MGKLEKLEHPDPFGFGVDLESLVNGIVYIAFALFGLFLFGVAAVGLGFGVYLVSKNPTPQSILFLVGLAIGSFCAALWAMSVAKVIKVDEATLKFIKRALVASVLGAVATGITTAVTWDKKREAPVENKQQGDKKTGKGTSGTS